jgi:hypothetical protein
MLIVSLALAASCAGAAPESPGAESPEGTGDTEVRLSVPAKLAGDETATPVLVLERVEIGAGEGMTIEVLGPPDPETGERALLAVSGSVGASQKELAEPREYPTLVVPLNETASRLLAGKREITLTLRLRDSPGRAPLKVERAYFDPR